MPFLALKVDVDTKRGTKEGVPPLVELLKKYNANATFLFSLGPDNTGRAIKRVFRKGFLQKVSRTSVVEHYGIKTLLYGTLLPAPDIGLSEAELLKSVDAQGFEVGIHVWDHIKWQDYVAHKDPAWTIKELDKAAERFQTIFEKKALTHGAAGWQMNSAAYEHERTLGFHYASDGRGSSPFIPVDSHGTVIGVPQLPSTLPTLDELIGIDGLTELNVHEYLLKLTAPSETQPFPEMGHVYTLHAELEGMRLLSVFERLLQGWTEQGYQLVCLNSLFETLDTDSLPHCQAMMGEIPGRTGELALQGNSIHD